MWSSTSTYGNPGSPVGTSWTYYARIYSQATTKAYPPVAVNPVATGFYFAAFTGTTDGEYLIICQENGCTKASISGLANVSPTW